MTTKEFKILTNLESALAYLEEDINALGYIQSEYFVYTMLERPENFVFQYKEIQNALETLFKSMLFNKNQIIEFLKNNEYGYKNT